MSNDMTPTEEPAVATRLTRPAELLDLAAGHPLGSTTWHAISQEDVDLFAEATGDRQWIHVNPARAAEGPFGGTIAHGYLTLSMAPGLIAEVLLIDEVSAALNYGLDKVRFPRPVPVGGRIRAHLSLTSARSRPNGIEAVLGLNYELEGADRPACVADIVVLFQ